MLWFRFFNTSTQREVFLNLAYYSVAIETKVAHIYPAMYRTEEYYTLKGKDVERLERLMIREAQLCTPANMGEPVNG